MDLLEFILNFFDGIEIASMGWQYKNTGKPCAVKLAQ